MKIEDFMSADFAKVGALVSRLVDEAKNLGVYVPFYGGGMIFGGAGVQRKRQLLHPATPHYPFPRGKFHTRVG